MAEPHPKAPHLPAVFYLDLGLRNLARNPLRTLLSLAALLVGIAVVTFLGALVDGWLRSMQNNFILTYTGHLQIQAPGHLQSGSLADRITDPDAVIRQLRSRPEVRAWSGRLEASGLASVAQGATGVTLLGVQPANESRVTRLFQQVSPPDCQLAAAHSLVLGADVAATLGVSPGDALVLMGQTPGGELVSDRFRLCGILRSGAPQLDRTLAMVPLPTLQRWLQLDRDVTQIVVRARDEKALPQLVSALQLALPETRYRVLTWRELDPVVWQWLRFGELYGLIILGIVVALTVTQVSNTMIMALYERQREFAVMEALGTRRRQLFLMIAMESLLLVLLGGVVGYAVGAAGVLWLHNSGIDFSHFSGAFRFFFMDPVVHPLLSLRMGMKTLVALLLSALLGGLYPAWRAARIEPLEAMR